MDDVPKLRCLGCGRMEAGVLGDPTDIAPSTHCGKCPPWICEWCGVETSMTNPCSCWISLEGMPLADIKAIFAEADLSVGVVSKDPTERV